MPERREVYRCIDGERLYQENNSGCVLSVGEEIALALKYTHDALHAWSDDYNRPEMEALAILRKVAAICVRAMEHHGAPERQIMCGREIAKVNPKPYSPIDEKPKKKKK